MTWIWHASYFLTTLFTFSDSLQVLKSLLMSWCVESGVLDEGDWDAPGQFGKAFQRHNKYNMYAQF